ncbi:hypothetical protein DL769_001588 [Monosporascus sp. CRB-8-3]|nr:hypothetical protein DL769_001588 [Monosporascus sp. CRB-8-3]
MRAAWRKSEIDGLLKDLDQLQRQLTLRILYHLSRVTSDSQTPQIPQVGGLHQNYSDIIEVLTISEKKLDLIQAQNQQLMDRQETVSQAHSNTYEWIFSDPETSDTPWSPFITWLERGTGCYWISGKAGSGKSTLMKYIFHQQRMGKALRNWAGQAHLASASFFFWNLGSGLQKTQAGLLRSLLYDILSDHPAVSMVSHALAAGFTLVPTLFAIDGLDEYDGDHQELVDMTTCKEP